MCSMASPKYSVPPFMYSRLVPLLLSGVGWISLELRLKEQFVRSLGVAEGFPALISRTQLLACRNECAVPSAVPSKAGTQSSVGSILIQIDYDTPVSCQSAGSRCSRSLVVRLLVHSYFSTCSFESNSAVQSVVLLLSQARSSPSELWWRYFEITTRCQMIESP